MWYSLNKGKLKKWTVPKFQLVADALTMPPKKCVRGLVDSDKSGPKSGRRRGSDVFRTTVFKRRPHKKPFGQ